MSLQDRLAVRLDRGGTAHICARCYMSASSCAPLLAEQGRVGTICKVHLSAATLALRIGSMRIVYSLSLCQAISRLRQVGDGAAYRASDSSL